MASERVRRVTRAAMEQPHIPITQNYYPTTPITS